MIETGILAHERERIKKLMESLGAEQAVVAEIRREAMSQSSETWHDNAPADATLHELGRIADAGRKLHELLNKPDHPDPDVNSPIIQIGSLAILQIWGDTVGIAVVGSPLLYRDDEFEDILEVDEVVILGPESPLGSSLIGKQVGSEGAYETESGGSFTYIVEGVDNAAVLQHLNIDSKDQSL